MAHEVGHFPREFILVLGIVGIAIAIFMVMGGDGADTDIANPPKLEAGTEIEAKLASAAEARTIETTTVLSISEAGDVGTMGIFYREGIPDVVKVKDCYVIATISKELVLFLECEHHGNGNGIGADSYIWSIHTIDLRLTFEDKDGLSHQRNTRIDFTEKGYNFLLPGERTVIKQDLTNHFPLIAANTDMLESVKITSINIWS